jgi:hypothetical protein
MISNKEGMPYFYKITNKLNGKYYYGSGQLDGYYGSGIALKRAYKKYGKDQFEYKVLRYFDTRKAAFRFEQLFLSIYKLDIDSKSYNTCRNANGGYISEKVYESNKKFMKEYRQTEKGSMKGLKNTRADQTIYNFYNIDTCEYKKSTVYEMNIMVIGDKKSMPSMFGYVVRGDRKIYKGWILAKNIDRLGSRQKLKEEHKKNISLAKTGVLNPTLSKNKKGILRYYNPETNHKIMVKHIDKPNGYIPGWPKL